MLTSTIVISGLVVLGVGTFLIYYKNKRKKLENETITPYSRPAQERIKFAKVNTDIKTTPISTSTAKQTKTPSKTSNTICNRNTYDDDFYPVYHDYGSSSHSSSHDSHSSCDSSSDSGGCDCSCGCD